MKSHYKQSKNCSIHGKDCEISGPYNFWTSAKSYIPDVLKKNSKIEVGEGLCVCGGEGTIPCSPPPVATPLSKLETAHFLNHFILLTLYLYEATRTAILSKQVSEF